MAMSTYTKQLLCAAGALLVSVVMPARANAQAALEPIRITESRIRADQLDQQAEEIERTDWGQLKKAAALREQAAELRTLADPKAVASLFWAARDRYYTDDRLAARRLMEESAEHAIGLGDVVGAATALTEAAYISADLKDVERTRRFAIRARLLALSPVLTDDQRSQLRARLGSDTAFQTLLAFAEKR
jgi:Lon protease-like protein